MATMPTPLRPPAPSAPGLDDQAVGSILRAIVEPGFFGSGPVHVALLAGGVVAVVCGVVGMFTVMRGQSYAAHGLGDISATGGAGSFLLGISPIWGFAGTSVVAAGIMDLIGVQRVRGRDLATGIVRGAGLGLAALFLYWDTTRTSTTGAPVTILFGSLFTIDSSLIWAIALFSVVAAGLIAALYRPLLLSSVSADLAYVRGISVRAVGVLALAALALAVSLSAMTIGAILSTALLVGPAATALRLTSKPGLMMAWSALISLAATWLGVLLAYDSYYWPALPVDHDLGRQGWPVSFFVVVLILIFFLLARARRDERGKDTCSAPS
jgi:zinc/manganese transport system permease protein